MYTTLYIYQYFFCLPLPMCILEVVFLPQNHLHLASTRDRWRGTLQLDDFHSNTSYYFTGRPLLSRNNLFGMHISCLSCLCSWSTLIKSSALQQQIAQRELESNMIAAVAAFWKPHEQTPLPTRISIAKKYGVLLSTFKACILCRSSKTDAAAARQKLHLCN